MNNVSAIKYADKIPYKFVLEHILRDDLVIKPMFGCYSLYAGDKLCLFLVDRKVPVMRPDGEAMENGVHIATMTEHAASLKADFPDADFRQLKEGKVWIFFASDHSGFEDDVIRACEMINSREPRIGR